MNKIEKNGFAVLDVSPNLVHLSVDFKETLEANGVACEYELYHCLTCGLPWESHSYKCFNHENMEKCIKVRDLVKDTPEGCRLRVLAIKDGFVP